MRNRCIFCNSKIIKAATICFTCHGDGPYMDKYPEAAAYACKGKNKNGKGKACLQWAKAGKPYCTYHKSQFKEESE